MGVHGWFGMLLRLLPRRFRERHGDDMSDAFASAYAERRRAGRPSAVAFVVRTTLDVIASALREHLRRGMGRTRRAPARRAGGPISWIDVKLAVRGLRRHPGLTLASIFALAVGIPVGLAPTHFFDGLTAPLPVPEGHRIRALRLWSPVFGRAASTTELDYEAWRSTLSSFEELGAFRETTYNVDADGEGSAPVRAAEVTASVFTLLRVPPLLGRAIQPADESVGAAAVVLLGHDLWRARYAGDPAIVGRTVRVSGEAHTVIGVMPEGFLFPERQGVWTPLRSTTTDRLEGARSVTIVGRLGEGVTDRTARAEFESVARGSAPPGRDERVRPEVVGYAYALLPGLRSDLVGTPEFLVFQALALVVLLVACANVGMLVFARTTTRGAELAVRTALGASRARLVGQVFTECLVLAALASGVGLLLAGGALEIAERVAPARLRGALPYWIDWAVGMELAARSLVLAVASAAAAGILPALRYTRRGVHATLQRSRSRRSGGRFGLSGVLIAADVAIAVAAVGFAATASGLVRSAGRAPEAVGIPAEEYLAVTLRIPAEEAARQSEAAGSDARSTRWAVTQETLVRALRDEPGVRTVAVADALPRMDHRTRIVEAEGVDPAEGRRGLSSRVALVSVDFFESLGGPILAGRGFQPSDLEGDRSAVVVNTTFAERVFGGQNALGRRIRFHPWGDGDPGPWKEIVGVVGHLGMRMISLENDQGVYEVVGPGELSSVAMGIHVGPDPGSFAPRLRALAHEVDPKLVVSVIGPLGEVHEGDWYLMIAASLGGALLVAVLLALAASGVYAITSFAVAQRRTEIGVRAALGASRTDIVRSVVGRALGQLAIGVVLGMPLAAAFFRSASDAPFAGGVSTLAAGVAVLVSVGLVACSGPTLRVLRVHPGEALRDEG